MRLDNSLSGYRVVAVHAHPDDEAIATGGGLAYLAARGADVTVITCTLGEQGEVIGEPYQQLVNGDADQLGASGSMNSCVPWKSSGSQVVSSGVPAPGVIPGWWGTRQMSIRERSYIPVMRRWSSWWSNLSSCVPIW